MTNQSESINLPEMPVSWNVRYFTSEGYSCLLTLRGTNGKEVLERAITAVDWLQENHCTPSPNNHKNISNDNNNNPAWCPIHQAEMKLWEKNGRSWYSHKTEEGWCNGKS